MNTPIPTKLKDIKLSAEIYDAEQLSTWLDTKEDRESQNCTAITDTSTAKGINSIAGTYAFRLSAVEPETNVLRLNTQSSISDIKPGTIFSAKVDNNYDYCGTVLAVDDINKTLTCTHVPLFNCATKNFSLPTYAYGSVEEADETAHTIRFKVMQEYYGRTKSWSVGKPFAMQLQDSDVAGTCNPYTYIGKIQEISYSDDDLRVIVTLDTFNGITAELLKRQSSFGTVVDNIYSYFDSPEVDSFYIWFPRNPLIGDFTTGIVCNANGYDAQASNTLAFAIGYNTSAGGKYAFVGGQNVDAGYNSFAFGNDVHAYCLGSIALGSRVNLSSTSTFAWNGFGEKTYNVKRGGTFNIWPRNGLSGFYIQDENIADAIDRIVDLKLKAVIKKNDYQEKQIEFFKNQAMRKDNFGNYIDITDAIKEKHGEYEDKWLLFDGKLNDGHKSTQLIDIDLFLVPGEETLSVQTDAQQRQKYDIYIDACARQNSVIIGFYDKDEKWLGYFGKSEYAKEPYNSWFNPFEFKKSLVTQQFLKLCYPAAKYVRFSSLSGNIKFYKFEKHQTVDLTNKSDTNIANEFDRLIVNAGGTTKLT